MGDDYKRDYIRKIIKMLAIIIFFCRKNRHLKAVVV